MENTLYCPVLMEMNGVPHSEIIQTDCISLSHSTQFEWVSTKTDTDRWMLLLIVCLSAIFILLSGTGLFSLGKTSSLKKAILLCLRDWRNERHKTGVSTISQHRHNVFFGPSTYTQRAQNSKQLNPCFPPLTDQD